MLSSLIHQPLCISCHPIICDRALCSGTSLRTRALGKPRADRHRVGNAETPIPRQGHSPRDRRSSRASAAPRWAWGWSSRWAGGCGGTPCRPRLPLWESAASATNTPAGGHPPPPAGTPAPNHQTPGQRLAEASPAHAVHEDSSGSHSPEWKHIAVSTEHG